MSTDRNDKRYRNLMSIKCRQKQGHGDGGFVDLTFEETQRDSRDNGNNGESSWADEDKSKSLIGPNEHLVSLEKKFVASDEELSELETFISMDQLLARGGDYKRIMSKGASSTLIQEYEEVQLGISNWIGQRKKLDSQLHENRQVLEELKANSKDNNVFKLVGPVLLKQDAAESKANVSKRIEFISGELKKIDEKIENLVKKQQVLEKNIVSLQGKNT